MKEQFFFLCLLSVRGINFELFIYCFYDYLYLPFRSFDFDFLSFSIQRKQTNRMMDSFCSFWNNIFTAMLAHKWMKNALKWRSGEAERQRERERKRVRRILNKSFALLWYDGHRKYTLHLDEWNKWMCVMVVECWTKLAKWQLVNGASEMGQREIEMVLFWWTVDFIIIHSHCYLLRIQYSKRAEQGLIGFINRFVFLGVRSFLGLICVRLAVPLSLDSNPKQRDFITTKFHYLLLSQPSSSHVIESTQIHYSSFLLFSPTKRISPAKETLHRKTVVQIKICRWTRWTVATMGTRTSNSLLSRETTKKQKRDEQEKKTNFNSELSAPLSDYIFILSKFDVSHELQFSVARRMCVTLRQALHRS